MASNSRRSEAFHVCELLHHAEGGDNAHLACQATILASSEKVYIVNFRLETSQNPDLRLAINNHVVFPDKELHFPLAASSTFDFYFSSQPAHARPPHLYLQLRHLFESKSGITNMLSWETSQTASNAYNITIKALALRATDSTSLLAIDSTSFSQITPTSRQWAVQNLVTILSNGTSPSDAITACMALNPPSDITASHLQGLMGYIAQQGPVCGGTGASSWGPTSVCYRYNPDCCIALILKNMNLAPPGNWVCGTGPCLLSYNAAIQCAVNKEASPCPPQ